MRPVWFHPGARREMDEAIDFYEACLPGLGAAFLQDLGRTLVRIRATPLAYPLLPSQVRRAVLSRFPYNLLFSLEDETLAILAVAHQRRRPRDGMDRPAAGGTSGDGLCEAEG